MTDNHRHTGVQDIVCPPGRAVKARLVTAGITCRQLAAAARRSPQTVSDCLAGRNRNIHTQIEILLAYCQLTGETLSVREFWGALTAPEAA